LYYLAFPHDRTIYKAIVGIVYFLESVHSIGLGAGLSIMMVNMNSSSLIIMIILMIIIGSLVALIAQCLYAHRIYAITDMTVIPLGIVVLAILQVAAAVASLIAMPVFPIYIWIGLTMVNDLVIAVVMVRALANNGSFSQQTVWKTTRLIRIIVETGVATAFVNFLTLLFVAIMGQIGDVYSAPMIIISQVYANSILVLLNNRMSIAGSRNAPPQLVKTVEVSRSSDFHSYNPRSSEFNPYNTLQGITLTSSQAYVR